MEWSEGGLRMENSNLVLFSAVILVFGNVIVQMLFSEYFKHPTKFHVLLDTKEGDVEVRDVYYVM